MGKVLPDTYSLKGNLFHTRMAVYVNEHQVLVHYVIKLKHPFSMTESHCHAKLFVYVLQTCAQMLIYVYSCRIFQQHMCLVFLIVFMVSFVHDVFICFLE